MLTKEIKEYIKDNIQEKENSVHILEDKSNNCEEHNNNVNENIFKKNYPSIIDIIKNRFH